MKPSELVVGARVRGLVPDRTVVLAEVQWIGDAAAVTWADGYGSPQQRTLLPDDIAALALDEGAATMDAAPQDFSLAIEALRIRYAHLLDPLMAVNAANVEPLPHQIQAVYDEMLARRPLRFLLADDPGAGKTIMAGLLIKEMLARGAAHRCLIIAPGGLVEQWQDEMQFKFGLSFPVFERSMFSDGQPFDDHDLLIARIDQIARDDDLTDRLRRSAWDLAIVDEAHKFSASYWGTQVRKTKRYELGEVLADVSTNFLLMTATPHSGKEDDFQLFLSLLDPARYAGRAKDHEGSSSVDDIMRRLVKEQLMHADGRPLFPERRATTVTYELSNPEQHLYERVSDYVRHEMDKVAGDESRRTVGFALLVLQRRLASSPHAILTSLERRRERLREQADRARDRDATLGSLLDRSLRDLGLDDDETLTASERESAETVVADAATASRSVAELEAEILILGELVELAHRVRNAGVDRKWDALARLLTSEAMFEPDGSRHKIIIFTEHRDTLDYLEERVEELLGPSAGIEVIHGGISRGDRRTAQRRFTNHADANVLLATDAAGEGVNLQVAHLMVNYDIPWNPNRLEQRFGRIHRIGQTEVCHLWNLVAENTREGDVFKTLLEKLETQREALGDRVFDVLGDVLTAPDLRGLLSDALRYGDRPDVRAKMDQTLSQRVGSDLVGALEERARSVSELTISDLVRLRQKMAVSQAARLQPHVVEAFTRAAMERARGELIDDASGRQRIRHVPPAVRDAGERAGSTPARRYEAATFRRDAIEAARGAAELLSPGHPLVDSLVAHVLDQHQRDLQRGVMLQDDRAIDDYLVATFAHAIHPDEGTWAPSERLVTLKVQSGVCTEIDAAVYTCLDPADPEFAPSAEEALHSAREYIDRVIVPEHVAQVRERFETNHRRAATEAERRMQTEIERLKERRDRLAKRGSDGDPEVIDLDVSIHAHERRLASRLRELEVQEALDVRDADLVALAYVRGTGDAAALAEHDRRRELLRRRPGYEQAKAGLAFCGYDYLVEREGGVRFVTVAWQPDDAQVELRRSEVLAASNLGAGHELVAGPEVVETYRTVDMLEPDDALLRTGGVRRVLPRR